MNERVRGGHRGYLTKIVASAVDLVEAFDERKKNDAKQHRENILETVGMLQKLDNDILNFFIAADEEASELDIVTEVEEAGRISSEAKKIARQLSQKIESIDGSENRMNSSLTSGGVRLPTNRTVCAKRPKLDVKRFNGNACEWQEFWDSFESAIHRNGSLSDVDKFNYFRGLEALFWNIFGAGGNGSISRIFENSIRLERQSVWVEPGDVVMLFEQGKKRGSGRQVLFTD